MAVQAQHPSSDHPSSFRAPIHSVLEGLHMMQSRYVQIDHLPLVGKAAAGLPNVSVFSDHPQSELTCNVSGSWKRSFDEMRALAAPTAALTPVLHISNPALLAASSTLKSGSSSGAVTSALLASREQSMRVFDSAAASTSGRPYSDSFQSYPAQISFGQEILGEILLHNFQMDALTHLQNKRIHLGFEQLSRRHYKSLLSNLEQLVVDKLREKETELDDATRKNAELEEKIQQMNAESQMWFNVAKNNELLASNLRTYLEQILIHNADADAAVPLLREGYGDSDGTPLTADDAESFCFDDETLLAPAAVPPISKSLHSNKLSLQQMNCKICGFDEVSVLVLPCRHLCLCLNCEPIVATCPICNYPKNASVQVFMA